MASIRLGPVNHRKLAKKLAATKVDLKEQINQNELSNSARDRDKLGSPPLPRTRTRIVPRCH